MVETDKAYVYDDGQYNGAENEAEIYSHDIGVERCNGRWNGMKEVYSVTVGEEDEGTEENKGGDGSKYL